ncbi:MAG TPA: alanine--tRNA ligase [Dehalococcoidia bacterium]|nr:alanine--tRNA ligase [Dehalococcoidia bacterium]
MNGDQIRSSFIRFFEGKGHLHLPSASLIPAGDPTLLFTSAGMVPFKPYFMGEQRPPSRRLTTHQKSFRTTDINEVGDHKHLTFFEMLGNFSIGDYFKQDAVSFAWELVTRLFQLEPGRVYVTIHLDDDEAYQIWHDQIGVPTERIYRYGDQDNWWGPAGNEGPTGPCSELHYDGGAEKGCGDLVEPDVLTALLHEERDGAEPRRVPGCHPNCDCQRFVELWNLVFMQFYQDTQGNRTPLPAPSVDTGMGLERAAAVLQGKPNVYETDLFAPIVQRVCELAGQTYGSDDETDYAIRVVAEHARAACFLIGDGVVPGNAGRGYVLRRIIRRAIRYGRRLGVEQAFLTRVAEVAITRFQQTYRELLENQAFILRVIGLEEERFGQTINRGNAYIEGYIRGINIISPSEMQQARQVLAPALEGQVIVDPDAFVRNADEILRHLWEDKLEPARNRVDSEFSASADSYFRAITNLIEVIRPMRQAAGEGGAIAGTGTISVIDVEGIRREMTKLESLVSSLPGREAFVLYDTHGFPPELTAEIAREHGLDVDMEGFEREMEAQRQRARSAQAFSGGMEMLTAYENLGVERSHFVGYQDLQHDTVIAAILSDNAVIGHATQGQAVEIVLRETPFYAEGGGQVGDQGIITGPNGVVRVEDTHNPVAGLVVHLGVVEQGDIALGDAVSAQVNRSRRMDAARNHSGTHLLHAALRSVLGPHVRQAGSLVAPDRLRFDFSHVSALSHDEQLSVQSLANEKVRENLEVATRETSYADAVRQGALAFFGDRYGDVVRVVTMAGGEPFSVEVCGGTHVGATGQVGTLFVLGESSIGGGMRRIEAITGRAAEQLLVDQSARLESLSHKLQTPVVDLEARLDSFLQDAETLRRRLAALERGALRTEAEELLSRATDINGVKVVSGRTSATSAEGMREMADYVKAKLPSVVVALGAVVNGSPVIVTMVTPDLVRKGLHAGNIARGTAQVVGGGGGGQAEMAQAGGRNAIKLDEALQGVAELVRRGLKSGSVR